MHDELIFEGRQGRKNAAMPVIAKLMEGAAAPAVSLTLSLKCVDAHAPHNCDEAH